MTGCGVKGVGRLFEHDDVAILARHTALDLGELHVLHSAIGRALACPPIVIISEPDVALHDSDKVVPTLRCPRDVSHLGKLADPLVRHHK